MSCYFDNKPIGFSFLLNPASSHYCMNCNTSFPAGNELGIYLGHFEQPSGRYALLEYIPNPICPTCGNSSRNHMLPCDDGDLHELFKETVKKDENINA
jgi:hypothetical protein